MNFQEATKIAEAYKKKTESVPVCISAIIPNTHGWWFEFETIEYMETADRNTRLGDGGNYPVFVSKSREIWNVVGPYNPRRFFEEYETYMAGGESYWLQNLRRWVVKAE